MLVLPYIVNQIIPWVLVLVGYLLKRKPVETISSNGYSTRTSRSSQENWDYGQKIAPGIFISTGLTLAVVELLVTVVFTLLKRPFYISIITGMVIGYSVMFLTFYRIDSKIKKNSSSC